jgi:hypothetical protein
MKNRQLADGILPAPGGNCPVAPLMLICIPAGIDQPFSPPNPTNCGVGIVLYPCGVAPAA